MKRIRYLSTIGIILLCLVLFSRGQLAFFWNLSSYALSRDPSSPENMQSLIRCYGKNSKIFPLLEPYLDNLEFLSLYAAEGMASARHPLWARVGIRERIFQAFPQNPFLDDLFGRIYGPVHEARSNFDFLSFAVLKDQSLNRSAFDVLTSPLMKQDLDPGGYADLIRFLNWWGNFDLSQRLLDWNETERKLSREQAAELTEDLSRRKRIGREVGHESIPPLQIVNRVERDFPGEWKIPRFGYKLLFHTGFTHPEQFRRKWRFSDYSDTESISKASFTGGWDHLENESMRLMGLFLHKEENKSYPHAGFLYRRIFPLQAERSYLLYFRYKSPTGGVRANVFLSSRLSGIPILAATGNQWREAFYFLNNKNLAVPYINLMFQIWGKGSVWFDDIFLFEYESEETAQQNESLFFQ